MLRALLCQLRPREIIIDKDFVSLDIIKVIKSQTITPDITPLNSMKERVSQQRGITVRILRTNHLDSPEIFRKCDWPVAWRFKTYEGESASLFSCLDCLRNACSLSAAGNDCWSSCSSLRVLYIRSQTGHEHMHGDWFASNSVAWVSWCCWQMRRIAFSLFGQDKDSIRQKTIEEMDLGSSLQHPQDQWTPWCSRRSDEASWTCR